MMNPSYILPQYPNPYACRFPGQGSINYVGWPNYSDVGFQLVYVQPQAYPPVPVLPLDPLLYAPTAPPLWRPRAPSLVPQVYPTMLNQHLVAPQSQNRIALHMSRTARPRASRGRNPESVVCNTDIAPQNNTQSRSIHGESRMNSNLKAAVNEMSVIHQLRTNTTTLYGQKRRVRRRRKKHGDKEKHTVTTGSAELSSIDMEGTQARLKGELRTIDNDGADQEYESFEEEEDVTPVISKVTNRNPAESKKRGSKRDARSERGRYLPDDSSQFTSISNNKSYSHVAYNRDLVSVKAATLSRGKTFVVRRTEKKMSVSHDIFEDRSESGEPKNFIHVDPNAVNTMSGDYWAAISGAESPWNATDREIGRQAHKYGKKNPICRCKKCIEKSSKKTRMKSSVASTPTRESNPSPDLWWDRSEYQWPTANENDEKCDTDPMKIGEYSDEYVVVDLNRDENGNIPESDRQDHSRKHDAGPSENSNVMPRRRLLSVDWESITRSRNDLGSSATSQDASREKSRSITELDQAIVERGPLTTEPFSFPPLLQASLNDTLKRLKSSAVQQGNDASVRGATAKKNELGATVTASHFQTAFISKDTGDEETKTEVFASDNKTGQETTCSKNDAAKPPTPAYTKLNAPRMSIHPVDLTPHLNGNRPLRRSNSCPRRHSKGFPSHVLEDPHLAQSFAKLQINRVTAFDGEPKEILPGSSSQASKQVEDEPDSKIPQRFDFPINSDLFRKRADGISTVNVPKSSNVRDYRSKTTGQNYNDNKQIYEKSKPLPPNDPPDRRSRTAPSTPSRPANGVRKTSVSMSDLRNALISTSSNDTAAGKNVFGGKNTSDGGSKKPKCSSQKGTETTGRVVGSTATNLHNNARHTKLATGFPFTGMLNETIRRNFREKSSPVAIFTVCQQQTLNKGSIAARSPSIDDWSTFGGQPADVSEKERDRRASRASTSIDRERRRNAMRIAGSGTDSLLLRLPVFITATDDVKPRKVAHRRPKHGNFAARRRNSLSSLHYSVLSKGVRQRHLRGTTSVQQSRALKAINTLAINKTYPAFSNTRRTGIGSSDHEKGDETDQTMRVARAENATKSEDGEWSSKSKLDIEGATVAPCRNDDTSTATLDGIVRHGEVSPENNSLSIIAEGKEVKSEGIATATNTVDNASASVRKHKSSFLSKWMKPRKRSKGDEPMSRGEARGQASEKGVIKRASRRPSRQDKIRATFMEKKNKLLGRDSKVRTKLPLSAEMGSPDVNGNVQTPVSTELEITGAASESGGCSDSNRRPKEDRTVRSALYKPTFLCLAAIEAPNGVTRHDTGCSHQDYEGHETENESSEVFDGESKLLPNTIQQRRDRKSIAGTPGLRINSETGDVIGPSESRLLGTILSSTKIVENESTIQ